jgi:hypothetical protein
MSDDCHFAFGADTFQDCPCPAKAAGHEPSMLRQPVTGYDDYLKAYQGNERGVVDEETAEEAWLSMIDSLEENEDRQWTRHDLKEARKIARDLGWLEADDE